MLRGTGLLRDSAALLVIVALATVPFLNKAFHIDDFSYLQISRQILRAPLQPYDFYWRTYDDAPEYVFARHPSPPLLNYVIAAGILFFGENEVPLRCIMSVFTTGAAVSVYWLAVRFRCNPLAAATLMVLNPLLVPSQNLMLDVPALSFGLGGIACHVWGTDRGSWRLVALGGLLAGLAVVTKYPALVLVAPMVFYSWTQRSRLVVVAVLVTMLPLVLWSVQNLVMERRVHFLESLAATPMDLQESVARLVPTITILGCGLLPVFCVPTVLPSRYIQWAILGGSLVSAGIVTCLLRSITTDVCRHSVQSLLFLLSGLFLVCLLIACASFSSFAGDRWHGLRATESWFCMVWLLASSCIPMRAPFVAARHVLWLLPPAVLLVTSMTESRLVLRAWRIAACVVVGFLGLAVGAADMELANIQRSHVRELIAPHARTITEPVYYWGEFGFAYYCEAIGLRPLPSNHAKLPRTFIVFEAVSLHPGWNAHLPPSSIEPWSVRNRGRVPISTISYGVNFYATGNRDLPFDFGHACELYYALHTISN